MKLHFHTDPVVMRIARKQVGAALRALGGTEYDSDRIELAVGEAIANAHEHAYESGLGPIRLELAYEPGRFTVAVHDEATGREFRSSRNSLSRPTPR